MKNRIFGIIPARGGSKRIPRKNLKLFNGKPLVQWTIEEAKKSTYISTVILSSDDDEILEIGLNQNIEIYHQNKKSAGDDVPFLPIAMRIMSKYHARPNDLVVLLQPTAPLRNNEDIDAAILEFQLYKPYSLVSVYKSPKSAMICETQEEWVVPVLYKNYLTMQSQKLPEYFIPNGALYIISFKFLQLFKSWYTPMTKAFFMPDFKSVDVDNEFEWLVAEFIHKALRKNKLKDLKNV